MIQRHSVRARVWVLGLTAVFGVGCSNGLQNAPVESDQARDVLRTALESWKKGEKVDALKSASPPIYVIDAEWQSGAVLKDYEILNNCEEKDAHLFCPVKLTVQKPDGKQAQHEVIYVISTAPNLTVSRKVF